MKNAFQIGGIVAGVFALHLISYRLGVQVGRDQERYGKSFMQMVNEVAAMSAFVIKLQDSIKVTSK